jgi:RHS repeat-associated protein
MKTRIHLSHLIFFLVVSLSSFQHACFCAEDVSHFNANSFTDDLTTHYVSDSDTGQITAKFVYEQDRIRTRHFYFYDEDEILSKSIVDDGSSSDPENLQDITQRHTTTFELTAEQSDQPLLIEKLTVTTPNGDLISQQEMRYDSNGNKICETHMPCDQNGSPPSSTFWQYNAENHLEAMTEGDGSVQQRHTGYQYDAKGLLQEVTKPDGVKLNYQYDSASQLTHFSSSDKSISYQYSYDANQNVIDVQDLIHGGSVKRTYNASNQITSETMPNGFTFNNLYDGEGRRIQHTFPDGSAIVYVYDSKRMTAVHRLTAEGVIKYTHAYSHDNNTGQLIAAKLIGNLGKIAYSYNTKDHYAGIQSPYWSENILESGYDAAGNKQCINMEDAAGSTTINYEYDEEQQIIHETGPVPTTYTYDSLGNRIKKNEERYEVDALNQLTAHEKTLYTYDSNGCLIEKRADQEIIHYQYDALNRLIQVLQSEKILVTYTYDAFGRRIAKNTQAWDPTSRTWSIETTLHFLYDGDREIGSCTADGAIMELRILGQGKGAEIGAAIAIELGQEVYAPIHNHQGSVCCLVDLKTQSVAECYRYTAFGEIQIYDASGQQIDSSLGNPWGFCSKRHDSESALINFGKRYYDPEVGRWTTPDPLGFCDGPNRYVFVHNNPISIQDLYGLFSFNNAWNQFSSSLSSAVSQTISYLHHKLSYSEYIKPYMDNIVENFLGKGFLATLGYYNQPSHIGVYGQGEFYDKVRITSINGVLNLHENVLQNVTTLSNAHGGINIHYVYYPTQGLSSDLIKSFFVKFGYVSQQARQLAETWKKLIGEMGGTESGGLIIHYAHSIGGTNTQIAKKFLSPEEQKMICVIAVGSASVIPDDGFKSVHNYISRRDGILFFDAIGYVFSAFKKNSNVIYLGSLYGMPFIDHLLSGSTYNSLLERLGQDFLESHPKNPK